MKFAAHVCLLALLGTAACGGETVTEVPPASMEGPPRWRLVREEAPGPGTALTLQVRTPIRARFRALRTGRDAEVSPWRALAAGQVVRVAWSHVTESGPVIEERPSPAESDVGRLEPHTVRLTYQFADRAVHFTRLLSFARPGKGVAAFEEALPPGKYEELPLPGRIELATALVSDFATGQATLRRRELEAQVVRPAAMNPGDRVEVLRLYLEMDPASAPPR